MGGTIMKAHTVGKGELYVDLDERRLFLYSEALNISAGVPHVTSRITFRGDQGRLYIRSQIDDADYDTCWSVRLMDASASKLSQKNPFLRGELRPDAQSIT